VALVSATSASPSILADSRHEGVGEHVESLQPITWHEPRASYDVVIVGGGGHGLATAYYLATRHGITNVAVVEADYIASGNTGRNTTIIRANYGIPEAIRFYKRSLELYQGLEAETGAAIFYRQKGHVWIAHTEMGIRTERARALMNQAMGVDTQFIGPEEIRRIIPQIDLTGGGRYPVLGASHHVPAATARHDRVAWAMASGATSRGVHVIPHRPVTGLLRDGSGPSARVVGVETAAGPIRAGLVLSAVGGRVAEIASMARVRLPVRTHPLHAFVTNDFEQGLEKIVASTELACYVSQTERGQMLIGAEFDAQPSFSRISSFDALRSYAYKISMLLPFLRSMRILRTWAGLCDISADFSPIMGETGVPGLLITTGWGTWGFKAIPAGGEQMAELIATGRTPALIAPFGLDRFRNEMAMADQASAGTR
jgi:sarcosine oxidase subunit beta